MSTPVPGVLSRRSHRRWARIRCAPPFARNEQPQLSYRQSQEPHLHAEQDAPDHGHGRDQAVPGPADSVSRAVLMTSRPAPGQALFSHLTGAEQNASYAGTAVEFTERHTFARYMLKYAKGISAAPSSTSPDPSSSDAAASAAPSSGSAGPSTSGHAADPPSADPLGGADMSLLQRAGVLQNTPYDA